MRQFPVDSGLTGLWRILHNRLFIDLGDLYNTVTRDESDEGGVNPSCKLPDELHFLCDTGRIADYTTKAAPAPGTL